MRKLLIAAVMAGGFLATGGAMAAHATSTCSNSGGLPSASTSGAQVCITQGPVQGTVTAAGSATTQSGYVVADGNPANPGPLGGYAGVDSNNGGEVVACSGQSTGSGEYDAAGSNNAVVTSGGAVTLPGSGGPCDATP